MMRRGVSELVRGGVGGCCTATADSSRVGFNVLLHAPRLALLSPARRSHAYVIHP